MIPDMVVFAEPVRVTSRLASMDLVHGELMDAVRAGRLAEHGTTKHHPRTAGGFYRWSESFVALCDPLAKRGWRKIEKENVPLIFDPTTRIALTVSGGNSATGIDPTENPAGRNLRTHRPKGRGTSDLIDPSAGEQQSLLAMLGEEPLPQGVRHYNELGFYLYFLMTFEDSEGTVRAELARPSLVNVKGEITDWAERIILGILPDAPEGSRVGAEPDEPVNPEVTVLRKAT